MTADSPDAPHLQIPDALGDDEFERIVHRIFEELIPFNRHLGLEVESLDPERPVVRFETRREHLGNLAVGSLHGGVISAALDTVGSLAALLSSVRAAQRVSEESTDLGRELRERLERTGTIDLRVDYLRPAVDDEYRAVASVLRTGRRVVVTRMELVGPDGRDVAVGTGTYIVS